MTERRTDVLIAGGGVGGCAAALAVAEAGCEAILTEETDWIGGQLTAQATPPDEHGWIERFGCTRSYRRFRENVRAFYRRYYPLTTAASSNPLLNPGNGWVSPLCHEPRVALAVLEAMLAPHVSSGRLTILREHEPIGAEITPGDHIAVVEFLDLKGGEKTAICADFIIDATELGDLLPLTRTEFVTGFESRDETGEPSAPDKAQPENVQAFSVCFAMDHRDGEDHTIEKPNRYDYWREYVPELDPPWPGRLLSWTGLSPRTMEVSEARFSPNNEPPKRFAGFWSYRRILDRANFEYGRFDSDVCIVNWPMIDYLEGNLCTTDATEKSRIVEKAKEQSLAMLYWLQTEAPRPDGGAGWPGLRLRNDIVGTRDGLAKHPYIRESRRIRAQFTVREQDVAAACRPERMLAEPFEDSVGVRVLPDRPAPLHRGRQLHRRRLLSLSDTAGCVRSHSHGKSTPRLQEPGYDPHHQRVLPVAPGRVEYRGGGRGAQRFLSAEKDSAEAGLRASCPSGGVPAPVGPAGSGACLA